MSSLPYLNTPSAPARASSSGSASTVKTLPRVLPVTWTYDWKSIVLQLGSIFLLLAWILAAILLWHRDVFLPINFFDDLQGTRGWLGNGNYNTLVALLASLVGAIISEGLAHGFQSMLRHRMLSSKGITMYRYQALVKLATGGLQLHLRRSAVVALIFFTGVTTLGSASQAAFGTSATRTNISLPFRFARISDNLEAVNTQMSLLSLNPLPMSNDIDTNVGNARQALSGDKTAIAQVYGVSEITGRDLPLYSVQWEYQTLLNVASPGYDSPLTSSQTALVAASSNNAVVRTLVEAFYSTVSCSYGSADISTQLTEDLAARTFTLSFPCGNKTTQYSLANPVVADSHACTDGSPTIYVYLANPSDATTPILNLYQCTISASSAMSPVVVSAAVRGAKTAGASFSRQDLPTNLNLVKYIGADALNNFGSNGWRALLSSLTLAESESQDRLELLEVTMETIVKNALARVSYWMTYGVETGKIPGLEWSYTYGQLEVPALKLHPTTIQLGWLVVPLALLLLQIFLMIYYTVYNTGKVDFTDPVAMALIGLASDRDLNVEGGSTGEFKDDKDVLHNLTFVYGAANVAVQGQADRLVLATGNANFRLGAPEKGQSYV